MRNLLICLVILVAHFNAHTETIRQVAERSVARTLASLQPIDISTTPNIAASFAKLNAQAGNLPIKLYVIRSGPTASTAGDAVIVAAEVDGRPQIQIDFIVAHEIAHLVRDHKEERIALYQQYIPGEITPEVIQAANAVIGDQFRQLAWQQEYQADRDAVDMLIKQGYIKDDILTAVLHMGVGIQDTVTHPSTIRRIINMRQD